MIEQVVVPVVFICAIVVSLFIVNDCANKEQDCKNKAYAMCLEHNDTQQNCSEQARTLCLSTGAR